MLFIASPFHSVSLSIFLAVAIATQMILLFKDILILKTVTVKPFCGYTLAIAMMVLW